jgi:small-conductance mechanosensitive channel
VPRCVDTRWCGSSRRLKRVDAGQVAEQRRQEAIAAQKRAEAARANKRKQDVARIRADIDRLVAQIKKTSGMTTSREQQLKVKDLYTQLNSKKNELVKLQNTPI